VPFLICSENIISSKQVGFIPKHGAQGHVRFDCPTPRLRRKNMGTVDRFVRASSQTLSSTRSNLHHLRRMLVSDFPFLSRML
jgi:hypothetical protein